MNLSNHPKLQSCLTLATPLMDTIFSMETLWPQEQKELLLIPDFVSNQFSKLFIQEKSHLINATVYLMVWKLDLAVEHVLWHLDQIWFQVRLKKYKVKFFHNWNSVLVFCIISSRVTFRYFFSCFQANLSWHQLKSTEELLKRYFNREGSFQIHFEETIPCVNC